MLSVVDDCAEADDDAMGHTRSMHLPSRNSLSAVNRSSEHCATGVCCKVRGSWCCVGGVVDNENDEDEDDDDVRVCGGACVCVRFQGLMMPKQSRANKKSEGDRGS